MHALALSGGGTKFIRHIAFADASHVDYDVIAGVSAGAIAAIPIALKDLKTVRKIGQNLKLKTFFSKVPVTKKGGFTLTALWRLLTGKSSAGDMGNLRKLLKEVITPQKFKEYQNGNYADCFVLAVSLHTGARKMWNLKQLSYHKAIEAIMASASIPFFTPPVWIDGQPYADGGIRDHSPGGYLLDKIDGITHLDAVYTRPENYEVLSPSKYKEKAIPILSQTIDVMNTEISKNDEFSETAICIEKGIQLRQFFAPAIMKSVYDVDNWRLHRLYYQSYYNDVKLLR